MRNKLTLCCLLISFWLASTACNQRITLTPTNTTMAMVSHRVTQTSQATATIIIPTPTITIPALTRTPLPTLPPEDAQKLALKMWKTNGGCLFPCWLGIIPGKTTGDEVYASFSGYADRIEGDKKNGYDVTLKFPDSPHREIGELTAWIILEDGIVDRIQSPEDLSLSEVLSIYGPPSEVRILAISYSTIDPIGRFTLVLFYKDKGFIAIYDGTNERTRMIHVCPDHIQGPQQVWLIWTPDEKKTFSGVGSLIYLISPYPPPSEADYIPLEQLTGLDVQGFYERYRHAENGSICMEM